MLMKYERHYFCIGVFLNMFHTISYNQSPTPFEDLDILDIYQGI